MLAAGAGVVGTLVLMLRAGTLGCGAPAAQPAA
jgi:hypothetical protein